MHTNIFAGSDSNSESDDEKQLSPTRSFQDTVYQTQLTYTVKDLSATNRSHSTPLSSGVGTEDINDNDDIDDEEETDVPNPVKMLSMNMFYPLSNSLTNITLVQ